MTKQQRSANRLAIALLLAAAAVAPALAQGDGFDRGRQLVRAAYPELVGQGAQVMIPLPLDRPWVANRLGELRILVYRAGNSGGRPDLVVHYDLDSRSMPIMLVTGPYSGFDRWAAFGQEVNSNPDWTDSTIRSRLETAGAKYASVTAPELLKVVNLDRFRPLLGNFRVIDTTFSFRTDAADIADRRATVEWTVRTELPRGSKVRGYVFVFEPFEAKLMAIRPLNSEGY